MVKKIARLQRIMKLLPNAQIKKLEEWLSYRFYDLCRSSTFEELCMRAARNEMCRRNLY